MVPLRTVIILWLWLAPWSARAALPPGPPAGCGALSPAALAVSPDGARLFVACATARGIAVLDAASGSLTGWLALPDPPGDLVCNAHDGLLYVACPAPHSRLLAIDPATGQIAASLAAGHTAGSLVLAPDGATLCAGNRFDASVSVFDLAQAREVARIPVDREPVAAALTPDGKCLLVAHHLPSGRADLPQVAASVSLVDLAARLVVKRLKLLNGASQLRDLRVSPDGRLACVTHLVAHFQLPTTQVDRGWMNSNALTLIDLDSFRVINTVLLDSVNQGAGNPWAIAWSRAGRRLLVSHAGSHELSVIDAPGLLARLASLRTPPGSGPPPEINPIYDLAAAVPYNLSFLGEFQQRLPLPGQGQRALAVAGSQVWVANYFSDSLTRVELEPQPRVAASVPLGIPAPLSGARLGEMLFNDAALCRQSWQSCASCHSADGRVDGLNWDLLNDGFGNPKNTRSLLFAFRTPPAMSLGVRETAATAVRAGLEHILFASRPEAEAAAIDAFLQSLAPIPSPWLEGGRLSKQALRGRELFRDPALGCARCHPPGLFTDLHPHEVGTRGAADSPDDLFDTPSLVEAWRTAPYLHNGSAPAIRDVLTTANRRDRHGHTSQLQPEEIEALAAYILSL